MNHNYEIIGPDGEVKETSPESCRKSRRIELDMLDAGYTIRLNGKRIMKAEVKKEVKGK